MLRQQIKDAYFAVNRWAVLPSTWLARLRFRGAGDEGYYLHLGCGTAYIPGMINADGNIARKKDLWLDLRNPLPFPDRSARFIYCSHTLEHLFPDEAIRLLKEMHRVLRDDGVARIATPSMEHALKIARGQAEYNDNRHFDDPLAQAADYLFCMGQHKYGYAFGLMADFAREAGFTRIINYSADRGTAAKQYWRVTVGDELEGSLVVELAR